MLRRAALATVLVGLLTVGHLPGLGQTGTNPLTIFQNYFVTGDYVVAGWVKGAPDGSGYAPGQINVPDGLQPAQNGVLASVPNGASIVAAYLYWATVEGNQSSFAGKSAFFSGYALSGTVLGNPNAPTSWSSGGCSGSSQGSKTMRTYRADVRPYLPLDANGTTIANGQFQVRLADSGSNGNATPIALGATLVIIYRVLSPALPLNSIVLYDGAFSPSNTSQSISQMMMGFYQPDLSPQSTKAKITHIVGNGQVNKNEQVYLNNMPLASIYGLTLPPFPGIYTTPGTAGSWDNPTWVLSNGYVSPTDTQTTSVVPSQTNSGCVSWGAIVFSTPVKDTDGDGLLDIWEDQGGYSDVLSGQWVKLPGANKYQKDIFVQLDYLTNLDGLGGPIPHSHLPKQAALDIVGDTFAKQNIAIHFDLGATIYQGDKYVVPAGTGGNAIPESQLICTDGATLCTFPGQPAVGWKGGVTAIQNAAAGSATPPRNSVTPTNFQAGRSKSYHDMLFGHSLGEPRSYWSTIGFRLANPAMPQLVSIVDSGNTATVTLQSPPGTIKPGDCPNAAIHGCGDVSSDRIHITGALGQTSLNGTYYFSNVKTSPLVNNVYTTTLTVTTSNVADGTYNSSNEPQLEVTYLGPTSSSGHSDFRGGGDSIVTFGLWRADDPADDQVGTVAEQAGTILHELGHTLALTHGGTFYIDPNNPSMPSDGLNCSPNYLSAMNYLFQVRGFVDGGSDYSSQTLPPLNEKSPDEAAGIGTANGQAPAHVTRWYAPPNPLDDLLQKTSGGRYATTHCDGTPRNEPWNVVRVDGIFTGALDWNNDFIVPDAVLNPEDLNNNGIIGDSAFLGSNDWLTMNLQQVNARASSYGASGGTDPLGGGTDPLGGGTDPLGGGTDPLGGGTDPLGGGVDQSEDAATATADVPTGLVCTVALTNATACVPSSGAFLENGKAVPLTWTAPAFGQTRTYTIWRAVGAYGPTQVLPNLSQFSAIKTLKGAPPTPSYPDSTVKNGTTYTYFVTDTNKQGAQSGPSKLLVVTVKF